MGLPGFANLVVSGHDALSARRGQAIVVRSALGGPTRVHQCSWGLFCYAPKLAAVVGSVYVPHREWGMEAHHQACAEIVSVAKKSQQAAKYAYALTSEPAIIMGGDFNYELLDSQVDADDDGGFKRPGWHLHVRPGLGMDPGGDHALGGGE